MIMLANETAILFDHKTENVTPVHYDGELKTLKILLGVKRVDTIRLDDDHVVFVDDEGLNKKLTTGFALHYNGKTIKFAGTGLLVGDNYGQNAPVTLDLPKLKIDVLNFKYDDSEES
jgi:hypothetical protein